jgi:hypothetical protein
MLANAVHVKEQFNCLECSMFFRKARHWFGFTFIFFLTASTTFNIFIQLTDAGNAACGKLIV